MKGLKIFLHSVRQLMGNLGAALKISVLPAVISVATVYLLDLKFVFIPQLFAMALNIGLIPWTKVALMMVVLQVMFVWVAVNWHRFVLQSDSTGNGIPPFRKKPVWDYILATLFLSVVLVPPISFSAGVLVGIAAGLANAIKSTFGLVVAFVVFAPPLLMVLTIAFRAGIFLPGVAVGSGTKMGQGWEASKLQLVPFMTLVFLFVAASLLLDWIGSARMFDPFTDLGLTWIATRLWIKTMLGLSILTTLYGHYIEKRPLV